VNREWDKDGGNRTLDNIPRLLFKTTEIDHRRLWGDSAYYNFVQQPMDYSQEQQPSQNDYEEGWKVFAKVVRIIQPSHCLFIGVAAAKSFTLGDLSYPQKVGRTWARVAKLEMARTTTELIFVQHLGRYFSWLRWHDYLQAHHVDFMNWLGAEPYVIQSNAQSARQEDCPPACDATVDVGPGPAV